MFIKRHKREWWFEPSLEPRTYVKHVPAKLRDKNPADYDLSVFNDAPVSRIGAFAPKKQWVYYNRLQPVDVGYIVPVYSLRCIATRYGLSQNSTRYFRKHILPEPYDIVRRRSVHAHHWSRFVLMVLDVVLEDLEHRGYLQFHKRFEDHLELLHSGVEFLEDHYAHKYDEQAHSQADKYGVTWLND